MSNLSVETNQFSYESYEQFLDNLVKKSENKKSKKKLNLNEESMQNYLNTIRIVTVGHN